MLIRRPRFKTAEARKAHAAKVRRAKKVHERVDIKAKKVVFVGVVDGVKVFRTLGYQKPSPGPIKPKLRTSQPLTFGLSDKP